MRVLTMIAAALLSCTVGPSLGERILTIVSDGESTASRDTRKRGFVLRLG
ncbi:hypothetical protein [Bradyrhizobium hipponense]|nr:hypothetical protein [Bradyrhizobium hipponense]